MNPQTQVTQMETIILFASDAHGIYIPQYFAEAIKREFVQGVTDDQWADLGQGPECEHYWDTWETVLNNASVSKDGQTYSLHQDGDLWLIDYDNASEEGLNNFFGAY